MSSLTTPVAAAKPPSVSPVATLAGKRILRAGFDPDILDIMASLLDPDSETNDAVKQDLETLLTTHWKAKRWSDLKLFSSADLDAALANEGLALIELNKSPTFAKKLQRIIAFATLGVLTADCTMDGILKAIEEAKSTMKSTTTPTPAESPPHCLVQVYDKKTVPTLDSFSGRDEDYFAWRESTINKLGIAACGRFVDDESAPGKHPEVAESVFYALRSAVHGGQAQSIAQSMLDDKTYDPVVLWKRLETYYDTNLNRANVLLFGIRRLVELRLDSSSNATKFISDYRDCVQRLRKINARMADDEDALRTLLLVAIQDDDFACVRDAIVKTPGMSVEAILSAIRDRETALMMRDSDSNHIRGDGTTTSRHSRRTQQSNNNRNGNGSRGGTSDSSNTTTKGGAKWNIPRFPDSWKQAVGGSMFKLMLDWRLDAHKGKSQGQLTEDFTTCVERVTQTKTKSRRMSTGTDTTVSTSTSSNASNDGDNQRSSVGTDDDVQKRKRIRLNKSRRIVTERNA